MNKPIRTAYKIIISILTNTSKVYFANSSAIHSIEQGWQPFMKNGPYFLKKVLCGLKIFLNIVF